MKVGKPMSKRTSSRMRHKIGKKSAEKQRKDRKAAKNVRPFPSTCSFLSSC